MDGNSQIQAVALDVEGADERPLGRPTGSVIIPAHNEEAVIGKCLGFLLQGLDPRDVEIIVVANGCTDGTAAAARGAAPQALVLEIERPSKPEALRTGDLSATRMPRLYLDADVLMTGAAAVATLKELASGAVAARPPAVYDSDGATWLVRRYFRARSAMPSLSAHAWGAGVYGLSTEARGRFADFPDVVGDDLWIDQLLAPGELIVVDTDPVVVRTPRDSRRLMRILRRAQQTKREPVGGEEPDSTQAAAIRDLVQISRSGPSGLVDALVYAGFALAARSSSAPRNSRWERDDSTRGEQ